MQDMFPVCLFFCQLYVIMLEIFDNLWSYASHEKQFASAVGCTSLDCCKL